MVTAPAPPVGKAPPLEEPPAPPVPKLRLDLLKGRAKKLRGRAPRGPHLRDIFGRPGPGAHRAEVKRETEQRAQIQAKVARQQQPGPAAVAAGAATGPIVERAVKTAKLKRETAPSAAPRRAPPAPQATSPAPPPMRRAMRRFFEDELRRDRASGVAEAARRAGGMRDLIRERAAETAAAAEEDQAKEAERQRLFEQISANAVKERDEPAFQDETTRRVAEAIRADIDSKEEEHAEAKRRAEETQRQADARALGAMPPAAQPPLAGPPRASDKTSGEIREDARAIITQWEHIAANTELPRSQRLAAQRRADQLRRIAEEEEV